MLGNHALYIAGTRLLTAIFFFSCPPQIASSYETASSTGRIVGFEIDERVQKSRAAPACHPFGRACARTDAAGKKERGGFT